VESIESTNAPTESNKAMETLFPCLTYVRC